MFWQAIKMKTSIRTVSASSLPPKKLDKPALLSLSIPMLVAHLATHERYARLKLRTEHEYNRYHSDYLDGIYRIGRYEKDNDKFLFEVALARIEAIPFSHKKKDR